MKLLVTTDAVGGVWDHSVTLTRQLVALGHEVVVAIVGRVGPERSGELPAGVHCEAIAAPLEWMAGGVERAARVGEWIEGVADRHGAEIVHLNQLTYAPWISLPCLVAVHGDAWSWFAEVRGGEPTEPRWRVYRDAVTRGLEAAGVVVAPSRYQSELTERHYGRRVHHAIWNGIELEGLHEASDGRAAEPSFGDVSSGRRRPVLVTVGRAWDEAKGVEVLDEALSTLEGAWGGYVAGDTQGPESQLYRARALLPLGRLPKGEVWQLLRHADLYVAPARYEPFGLSVVEAACADCALVLSDIGSFREIWGDAAVFFPPGDARALARILRDLADDPARVEQLAARACARARERFAASRMASEYIDIYRALRAHPALQPTGGMACD